MHFRSDNTAPICPEILAALAEANQHHALSYGADPYTERLTARAREIFEKPDLDIYPVGTGTAANALALATLVPPYGAILAYEEAHIATDECGAPEFYTGGAKIVGLPSPDGKLTPAAIDAAMVRARDGGVHHVLPQALSVTQATEWGTIYSLGELRALTEQARAHALPVHMDGARFANALATLGCSPADLTWRSGIDVLSLGATKNGALAAEAVLFFNPAQEEGFERRRKRAGQLWSKQRYLSAQLVAYFENDLWLRNARHANRMAALLRHGLTEIRGVELMHTVQANELFVAMPETTIMHLEQAGAGFYRWIAVPGEARPVIRLVTSFATAEGEIQAFIEKAKEKNLLF